jgi:hypothetical protein
VVLRMCFSRKSYWREEQTREEWKDPVWDLFYRKHEGERPQWIADRERTERDAGESREKVPAGIEL